MPYKNLVIKPPQYLSQDTTQKTQFYKGFSTVNNTNTVTLFDHELIKQDIINHFSTRKGERVMNPNFGSIIWHVLFDPLTEDLKQDLQDDIRSILKSDPRVQIQAVQVDEKEYGILMEITLLFVNSNQTEVMRLNFDRETGLNLQ